jgi:hypothetical protein
MIFDTEDTEGGLEVTEHTAFCPLLCGLGRALCALCDRRVVP